MIPLIRILRAPIMKVTLMITDGNCNNSDRNCNGNSTPSGHNDGNCNEKIGDHIMTGCLTGKAGLLMGISQYRGPLYGHPPQTTSLLFLGLLGGNHILRTSRHPANWEGWGFQNKI